MAAQRLQHAAMLLSLALLISCGTRSQDPDSAAPPAQQPADPQATARAVDPPQLIPLADPQTLLDAGQLGRRDPFSPLAAEHQSGIGVAGLSLVGLALLNGEPVAFVHSEAGAGSLRPGDVGGVSTDLLPDGWVVLAVDPEARQVELEPPGPATVLRLSWP